MASSSSLNRQLTGNQLEEEDEVVILPHVDNSALIDRYKLSLVGRMFHRDGRSVETAIALLPKENIWNVAGRVRGIPLGNSRFQFDFDSERDLQKILKRRPCHFNKWSFALERWEPHLGDVFPNTMNFWIHTEGIPSQYWMPEIFRNFGNSLGVVRAVDAPMARIQVTIKADEPLRFRKKTQIPTGELIWVSLRYERLFRWCKVCHRICHEEETCPLIPVSQIVSNKSDKVKETSLGKLSSGKEISIPEPPQPARQNVINGRTHPSWWRPDLVNTIQTNADTSNADYRKQKAEGKRPANTSAKNVWRRIENNRSQTWVSSSRERHSNPQEYRNSSHGSDRRPNRNVAPIPRQRETLSRQPENKITSSNRDFSISKDSGRKRRFDDTFEAPIRKSSSSKERALLPAKTKDVPQIESTKVVGLSLASDSQVTVSDPLVSSLRAKQGVSSSSPSHIKERPFRLNLKKRSDSIRLDHGGALGKQTMGDSSDTGSSAKKSLNFDLLPPEEEELVSRQRASTRQSMKETPKEKSWYEQTVEDEAREAREALLETRFTNSIRIDDDQFNNPEDPEIRSTAMEIETEENWEEEEYMNEDPEGTHQEEVEEGDLDWEENNGEEDRVDLEWDDEEDSEYLANEKSLLEAGENLDNDDLLGEAFEDLKEKNFSVNDESLLNQVSSPSKLGLGQSKHKGKKKEKNKKALTPKAQIGQANVQGAASKKLFNIHGRFSPKNQGTNPNGGSKPITRQSRSSASGPGNEVFPSSLKSKVTKSTIDTGGPSNPPDRFHEDHSLELSRGGSGSHNSPTGRNV